METMTVTLHKRISLAKRIAEAGRQVRGWLQSLEVAFNEEKDKLQLAKWELKNGEFRYHYAVIKGESSSVFKAKKQAPGTDLEAVSDVAAMHLRPEGPLADFSHDF